MKLPFSIILSPLLKPYLSDSKLFCQYPTFAASLPYTYIYGTLGLIINVHHLRSHLGEIPINAESSRNETTMLRRSMIVHDLKIIATSMGLVQYSCLVLGCLTENPGLFLPHLIGQLLIVAIKILNLFLFMTQLHLKSLGKLTQKVSAILLMTFNWMQEFCVFRQYLCICDL